MSHYVNSTHGRNKITFGKGNVQRIDPAQSLVQKPFAISPFPHFFTNKLDTPSLQTLFSWKCLGKLRDFVSFYSVAQAQCCKVTNFPLSNLIKVNKGAFYRGLLFLFSFVDCI